MVERTVDEARDLALIREEVRTWLSENWDAEMPIRDWRQKLLDTGWGVPQFPAGRFGRGLTAEQARVVASEFQRARAAGLAGGMARSLASPSIVEHGTDEQVRRLVPPALLGDQRWCQLFSEPGAGSDLAGVTTTAVLSGDEWVVNGQKVWTSGAVGTDMGMLVCRTDWDVTKHQGISWIGLPIKQEGIDIRPLRQMTGGAGFNEVFITDARAPKDNAVGGVNGGWKVTTTTLAHERGGYVQIGAATGFGGGGGRGAGRRAQAGAQAGAQATATEQHEGEDGQAAQAQQAQAAAMAQRMQGGRNMIQIAKDLGKNANGNVRQMLIKHWMLGELSRMNSERAAAESRAGKAVGPAGSMRKMMSTIITRSTREVGMALLGAGGMLTGANAPYGGSIAGQALSSPGPGIFAGTHEIQHNILGERVLGLPKEPSVDIDIPFREVKNNLRK